MGTLHDGVKRGGLNRGGLNRGGRVLRWGAALLGGLLAWAVETGPARAEDQLQLIRDAEIEDTIRTLARPIFAVAGIDPEAVEIVLVKDPTLNAFVAGGQKIFFHTGLLMEAADPSQLMGVIAHETGHIAGGHLIRGREAMETASAEAILSMLLGVGAAIASGDGRAAGAVVLGGQEMARRSLFAFSRAQEASADHAALSYFEQAHLSARGMQGFFEKLGAQDFVSSADRQVAYTRTHPLTRDRIDTVVNHVEHSAWSGAPLPPGFDERHQRMRAKLYGFIYPQSALQKYAGDPGLTARYARATAYSQRGEVPRALEELGVLLAKEPNNPFFHELKGQTLMENRRVAESLPSYRRAVELMPNSGLLHAELAQALLEAHQPALVDEALRNLTAAARQEKESSWVWRLTATAWGGKDNKGMMAYAMAEESMARGDKAMARAHARRARTMLAAGTSPRIRADDICALLECDGKEERQEQPRIHRPHFP